MTLSEQEAFASFALLAALAFVSGIEQVAVKSSVAVFAWGAGLRVFEVDVAVTAHAVAASKAAKVMNFMVLP